MQASGIQSIDFGQENSLTDDQWIAFKFENLINVDIKWEIIKENSINGDI